MANWSEADIPDQTGRTVLITGANSGLGLRSAQVLAGMGARVLLGCRSAERGRAAVAKVGPNAELVEIDLADLASVRKAAADVLLPQEFGFRARFGPGSHPVPRRTQELRPVRCNGKQGDTEQVLHRHHAIVKGLGLNHTVRFLTSTLKAAPLVALSTLLSLTPAFGQTVRGVASGIVLDPGNRPIKGATIQLIDVATQRERSATSGSAGQFTIPNVPAGEYRLLVKQLGFVAYEHRVVVEVGNDVDVEVRMDISRKGDSVDVTAPAEALKTDSATVSGNILRGQLQSLPLDGRNFYELSLLLPGVALRWLRRLALLRGRVTKAGQKGGRRKAQCQAHGILHRDDAITRGGTFSCTVAA